MYRKGADANALRGRSGQRQQSTHTLTPRNIHKHINMSRHEPETYTITLRRTPIRFPFVPLQLIFFLNSKLTEYFKI